MLSSLLLELIRERSDRDLLRELLIFDWLRCGHHFLPPHLEQEHIVRHRKMLWKEMPLEWDGVYDYRSRDEFFKQGVFYQFSKQFLQELGLENENGSAFIRFQPEREETVFRQNRFMLIPTSVLEG